MASTSTERTHRNMVGRYSPTLGTEMNAETVAMEFEIFVAEMVKDRIFTMEMFREAELVSAWSSDDPVEENGHQLDYFAYELVDALRSTIDGSSPIDLFLNIGDGTPVSEEAIWGIYDGAIVATSEAHVFDPEERLATAAALNATAGAAILSWVYNIVDDGHHHFTVSAGYGEQLITFDSTAGIALVHSESPAEEDAAEETIGAMLRFSSDLTFELTTVSETSQEIRIWTIEGGQADAFSADDARQYHLSFLDEDDDEDDVDDGQTFHDAWPLNLEEVLEAAAI
jgi:hypothetical protein